MTPVNLLPITWRQLFWLLAAALLLSSAVEKNGGGVSSTDTTTTSGPSFTTVPPSNVDFSNSSGVNIKCAATGMPAPTIQWIHNDDRPVTNLPSLRHISSNGTLSFLPFRAEDYRQDIHAATYRCMATNSVGTIVSHFVRLRAVVNQVYEAQVYDEFVIKNNTAVLKCHIPSFVMDYVAVTAWIIDDSVQIDSSIDTGSRLSVLPNGELVISDVRDEDARSYRCRTQHRLNGQSKLSATTGRLLVTEPQGSVPPRWASHRPSITVDQGKTLVIPCIAQGYPTPTYSWNKRVAKTRLMPLAVDGHRVRQISGTLVIRFANSADAGVYVCLVNNSVGVERVETTVTVAETLSVTVHPTSRVIQVGHVAEFTCVVTGHPVASVYWLKNGRPVTSSSTSTSSQSEMLRVANAQKGDVGMYQCFAGNDIFSAQAAAELKLGDSVPSIQTKFYEETYQPGGSVSLSCSAYGNPSPKFEWSLDHQLLTVNSQRLTATAHWSAEGDSVSVLNISEVRTEDGGEYTCTAKNYVGEASHSARLNIYGPPFVRRMPPITTVADRDVQLKCLYGGYPIETISWEKDGSLLPVDFRQEVPYNGTLIVRRVQRLIDSGRYTCRVRSPMGQEAQQQVDVRIMTPPNIDPSTFQSHKIDEGSHARVICGVTDGDLPINFTWLRDGRPLSKDESGIVVRNIDEFSNVMTIKNVMISHTGKYTCVATNAADSTNRTTELKVRVPPKWRIEPTDVRLVVGQSITLNCLADGFPTPVTSWMKVIGSVPTGPRQELVNDTRVLLFINGSLHISNTHGDDEGYYFCLTTNGIGAGLNKMIYINIKSPAKFDVHYRQETTRKGKEVSLACQATGEPPLYFTWNKDDREAELLMPHRYKIDNKKMNVGGVSMLRIESAHREDSGVFGCNVRNNYGHDSLTIHLLVVEPPDIPLHVKVVDYGSRKVKLSWSQPFDGNSPVLKYRVEGKLSSAEWSDSMLLLSTPTASVTAAEVEGLLPATKYTFRVLAENEVGVGLPSESVSVVTEDEAPSAPPQDIHVRAIDSETLRVTWKPPPHSAWNGELLGYNVGFRPAESSSKPYLYNTLELNAKRDTGLSTDLKGLNKYTKYGIVIRAFNRVGLGPLSSEILELTAEDVPTDSPESLECSAVTSESLQVSWKAPSLSSVNGVLQGYKVVYRSAQEYHGDAEELETKITSSLRTSLHGLKKFSNYSVQVLAFTRIGDGVKSDPVYCTTLEDVPGSPNEIKALAVSSNVVLVTWKHPQHPNGLLTKYSVYVRSTENTKESTTIESVSPATTHYYWKNMKENGRYEFWITASTSIGEGLSTTVVTQRPPGSVVSARVASFGDVFIVRQSQDVELSCLAVGVPPPNHQWTFKEKTLLTNDKWTIFENGSLIVREVVNSDAGNYTCKVHNSYGVDSISYTIIVQEPPSPPQITISTATSDMINIKWKAEASEMPLRGFLVHFKRDFGEWEELNVPKDQNDFVLEGLDCGTRYHVHVSARNDIGVGKPSPVTTVKTEGTAPIKPDKERLVVESSSFVTLYLEAWRTGLECPILYFVVEHKMKDNHNWTLVSNNVQPQQNQFIIPDLVAATWYNLRMTAHNTAGSTVAIYDFATLTAGGATIATIVAELGNSRALKSVEWTFYFYLSLSVGALALVLGFGLVAACVLHTRKKRRQTTTSQDEKTAKTTNYVPCNNTEKYERASTPTSFTYLMRNKDRPSSGSRQVSDTSTKVSEEDVCPYATFQISDRKSHCFNEELKTFGSPDNPVNVRCMKDSRSEGIYQKSNTLHPKFNCAGPVDERLHWSPNPGGDMLIAAHLTESALELQISQNCDDPHAVDCGDLRVPDLLYHGVESGSSNEDSSPISTCSYELHQQHHTKLLNLDPRLRIPKSYEDSYGVDDTSAFFSSLPRSHISRPESYVLNHHDQRRDLGNDGQVWFHKSNQDDYHHYSRHKPSLLEMNPVDSSC